MVRYRVKLGSVRQEYTAGILTKQCARVSRLGNRYEPDNACDAAAEEVVAAALGEIVNDPDEDVPPRKNMSCVNPAA